MDRTSITGERAAHSRIWLPLLGSAAGHGGLLAVLLLLGQAPGTRGVDAIQVLLVKVGVSARPVDRIADPSPIGGKIAAQGLSSSVQPHAEDVPPAEVHPVPRPPAPAPPARASVVRPAARQEKEGFPVRVETAGPAGTEEDDGKEGGGTARASARVGDRSVTGTGSSEGSAGGESARAPGDGPAGNASPGTLLALRARIQERIVYPEEAVRRGQQGDVLLRIRVGTGGVPSEIRIARSSGIRLLDEAASRGVVRAAPLPSDPGWVEVPIRFRLR